MSVGTDQETTELTAAPQLGASGLPRRGLHGGLVVNRWARHGKRRLYVDTADGAQVGWVDLDTGTRSLTKPELAADFERVVSEASQTGMGDAQPPRRALPEPAAGADSTASPKGEDPRPEPPISSGPDFLPAPSASPPAPLPVQLPPGAWAPPVGPPVVADLAWNRPGAQLATQIEAAHQAGQRPTVLRRLVYGRRAYSSWELGAMGEQLVARELGRLALADPRWEYLNSIPVGTGDSDIDHLVIGPGGVFTVNAKHHSGARIWVGGDTVMVNGTRHPYIRNSRFEANRASRLLTAATGTKVDVRGLVVPVGVAKYTVKQQPADVDVITQVALVRYLARQPAVLDSNTIQLVLGYARLSSTWTADG